MRTATTILAIGAAALGTLPLVGCGSDRGVTTAPSSVQTAVAPATASVVTTGESLPRGTVNTTTPITVTSLVSGTSCPTLQFMVSSYVFKVDAATQYSGGACANIQPGAKINFSGTRLSETSSVFYVAQLSFVSTTTPPAPTPTPAPTPVQIESTITAIGAGMCPELQFFFGSYALNVSYATQYSGGACGDLKAGAKVAIVGTKKDTEAFVRVTNLTFKRDTTPTPPPVQSVDGEGVTTSLKSGTSCPALAFYIGSYLIVLDTSTVFGRGACRDLTAGVRVHVTGGLKSDGSVAATQVSVQSDSPGQPVAEGEGRVSSLVSGTACPALKFMIEAYTVSLDASTTFVGGTCSDVAAGKQLGVKGTVIGDKQVLATQIVFKASEDN